MGGAAVSCLVHARKRPSGPLTRRYSPSSGKPSPCSLRPRTAAPEALFVGIALQGGEGDWQNLSKRSRLRRASAPLTSRSPLDIGWRLSYISTEQSPPDKISLSIKIPVLKGSEDQEDYELISYQKSSSTVTSFPKTVLLSHKL